MFHEGRGLETVIVRAGLHPSRGTRAFALPEMLITLLLLVLVLSLSAQLLDQGRAVLSGVAREAADPAPLNLRRVLRQDLQSATSTTALSVWTGGELVLRGVGFGAGEGGGESTVRWSQDGRLLVRETLDDDGGRRARRVMLDRLETWRFRRVSPRLVEVEVRFLEADGRLRDRRVSDAEARRTRSEGLLVALRNRPGSDRW